MLIKNRMTIKKGLLLAGLAGASIALLSQPALAAKQGKVYHEEEWKKTKTYGNTLIAEDSTTNWGPWKQFIRPAAGPLAIAPMPGMRSDGANYYRPETVEEYSPKYTLDEKKELAIDPCQGGEWCGYMAYKSTTVIPPRGDRTWPVYLKGGPVPTRMTMGFAAPDGAEGVGTVTYALTGLTDHELNDLEGEIYNSGDITVAFYGSLANFNDNAPYSTSFNGANSSGSGQSTYGSATQWWGSNDARWGTADWSGGPFVAGNTTPLADMATRSLSATFNGMAAGGAYVNIAVNFDTASWTGSWNGGSDGAVAFHNDSATGTQYVTGRVGFNVTGGTITGADFRSTGLDANDGAVTGTVIGNFFGAGATTLGGISDITKSSEAYEGTARNVDVFVACQSGCGGILE